MGNNKSLNPFSDETDEFDINNPFSEINEGNSTNPFEEDYNPPPENNAGGDSKNPFDEDYNAPDENNVGGDSKNPFDESEEETAKTEEVEQNEMINTNPFYEEGDEELVVKGDGDVSLKLSDDEEDNVPRIDRDRRHFYPLPEDLIFPASDSFAYNFQVSGKLIFLANNPKDLYKRIKSKMSDWRSAGLKKRITIHWNVLFMTRNSIIENSSFKINQREIYEDLKRVTKMTSLSDLKSLLGEAEEGFEEYRGRSYKIIVLEEEGDPESVGEKEIGSSIIDFVSKKMERIISQLEFPSDDKYCLEKDIVSIIKAGILSCKGNLKMKSRGAKEIIEEIKNLKKMDTIKEFSSEIEAIHSKVLTNDEIITKFQTISEGFVFKMKLIKNRIVKRVRRLYNKTKDAAYGYMILNIFGLLLVILLVTGVVLSKNNTELSVALFFGIFLGGLIGNIIGGFMDKKEVEDID